MFEDFYYKASITDPQICMLSNDRNQDSDSQQRLVNILRTVMFRRTHASRLFALPVIKFPDIEERIVEVEFYEAEREIYDAIVDVFFNNINGKLRKYPNSISRVQLNKWAVQAYALLIIQSSVSIDAF